MTALRSLVWAMLLSALAAAPALAVDATPTPAAAPVSSPLLLPTVTPTPLRTTPVPAGSSQEAEQLFPDEEPLVAAGPVPDLPWRPPMLSPRSFRLALERARFARCRVSSRTQDGVAYVFPVQPPEIAWYGALHHDYPAADIAAPIGSEFVAVTDGVVDELSREDLYLAGVNDGSTRGGRFVSIVGVDGVRYYGSHLNEVTAGLEPGDCVRAGQVLGYVGMSGNAAGTLPHVHFGISYPSPAGDWEIRRGVTCPQPYLDAWRAGVASTPDVSDPERMDRSCVFFYQ